MFAELGKQLSKKHDKLRLGKDVFFKPLVSILPRWLRPNQVTLFRFIIVLVWLPFAIFNPAWWQIAIFFFVYFLDLLDGAVARFKNKITYFGHFFDHFSDRINHMVLYIALVSLVNYQLLALKLLVLSEALAALFLIVEYFLKNKKFSHIRVFFQLCVTVILWLILIYEASRFI